MQFRASEKAVSLFSGELLVSMDTAEFPRTNFPANSKLKTHTPRAQRL